MGSLVQPLRDHSELMSERTLLSDGWGLESFKKRPDINCFSKTTQKLRTDIFRGDGGGRETHEMTNLFFT